MIKPNGRTADGTFCHCGNVYCGCSPYGHIWVGYCNSCGSELRAYGKQTANCGEAGHTAAGVCAACGSTLA